MSAEYKFNAHHCEECKDIPYHSFSPVIRCWALAENGYLPSHRCSNLATYVIVRAPGDCECESCWQREYHSCEKHLEDLKKFFCAVEVRKLEEVLS